MKNNKTSNRKKIIFVVGTRPNFMKIAPLMWEIKKNYRNVDAILVHTGQHYDARMSKVFFDELNIEESDYNLGVGSGSHAVQTSKIMETFERVVIKENPDMVVVVGDVNSTLACSLVAAKLKIPVAHIEAGLRSYNRNMPEEINRIVTDSISDYLFTTEESANANLIKEGIPRKKIHFVGNIMIDTLRVILEKGENFDYIKKYGVKNKEYALCTLHRSENVDDEENLSKIADILNSVARKIQVIFPIHPRTKENILKFGLKGKFDVNNLLIIEPVGYIEFLNLEKEAMFVLTDSGGIQEETTVLKIPCITVRNETERPITVKEGSNVITGLEKDKVLKNLDLILNDKFKRGKIPKYWDGKTSSKIMKILMES